MKRHGFAPVTTEPPGLAYADPAHPELATIEQTQQYGTPAVAPQIIYVPVQAERNHPLSSIVMILGALGFVTVLTAPVAWVLGASAMHDARMKPHLYSRNQVQLRIGITLGQIVTIPAVMFIMLMTFLGIIWGVH